MSNPAIDNRAYEKVKDFRLMSSSSGLMENMKYPMKSESLNSLPMIPLT